MSTLYETCLAEDREEDLYTAADAAMDERESDYQRVLAKLTEAQAVEALDCVPFAQLFRDCVSDKAVGQLVRLALHSYVELQAATDPDEIDRLSEKDTVAELLQQMSEVSV